MKRVLDTNICIALINQRDAALTKRVLAMPPNELALCSVVRGELEYGARSSQHVARNLDRVLRFCAAFESLPFDDEAAVRYGEIHAVLRREGTPIGTNDMMIAAIAVTHELALVTRNVREFGRVPGLTAERW